MFLDALTEWQTSEFSYEMINRTVASFNYVGELGQEYIENYFIRNLSSKTRQKLACFILIGVLSYWGHRSAVSAYIKVFFLCLSVSLYINILVVCIVIVS
jgi:hypothetical protein